MTARWILAAGIAAALAASSPAAAAPGKAGSLDPSFGDGGAAIVADPDGGELITRGLVVEPSGGLVTVGLVQPPSGVANTRLFGLTPQGTIDTTFGLSGRASFSEGAFDEPSAAVREPDGKILVLGTEYQDRLWIARFNPGGTLDFTFGDNGVEPLTFPGGPSAPARIGLATDIHGRILIATRVGDTQLVVERLRPNGSPDPFFAGDGVAQITIGYVGYSDSTPVAALPDGRVIVGYSSQSFTLYRLTADGRPDRTFGDGGQVTGTFDGRPTWLEDLALGPNGSVILAGYAYYERLGPDLLMRTFPMLAKITSRGQLDRSFGRGGETKLKRAGTWSNFVAVAVEGNGRIVAVGSSSPAETVDHSDFLTARYNADGSRDRSFSNDGFAIFHTSNRDVDVPAAVALDRRHRIIVAGDVRRVGAFRTAVVRYLGR